MSKNASVAVVGFSATHQGTQEGSQRPPAMHRILGGFGPEQNRPQPLSAREAKGARLGKTPTDGGDFAEAQPSPGGSPACHQRIKNESVALKRAREV